MNKYTYFIKVSNLWQITMFDFYKNSKMQKFKTKNEFLINRVKGCAIDNASIELCGIKIYNK